MSNEGKRTEKRQFKCSVTTPSCLRNTERESLHGKESVNYRIQIGRVPLERVAPEQNFERQKEFSYR